MATAEPPHTTHPTGSTAGHPRGRTNAPTTSETDPAAAGAGNGHPGVVGNERLTALTGAVLLVLALVEIATVPTLRSLLSVHFFVGVLLAGPVLVKTASTGWRLARYYTRHPAYRRKGPPRPLLRVLAPLLAASTLMLIGSGIALAITGPAPAIWIRIHVISFLVWLGTLAIHAAAYVRRVPRLVAAEWRHRPARPAPSEPAPGRRTRLTANLAALIGGAIAAVLLLPTASAWMGWLGQGVNTKGVLAVVVTITTAAAVLLKRRAR